MLEVEKVVMVETVEMEEKVFQDKMELQLPRIKLERMGKMVVKEVMVGKDLMDREEEKVVLFS